MRLWHIVILTMAAGLANGQDQPDPSGQTDQPDPPSRVARLNYINGAVSFQPGDVEDWVPAQLNRPLTTGDHVWVDRGGAAELHIGSTAIRLSGETGFSFLNLDDRTVQIQLSAGALNIRVRDLEDGETFEVDTPNLAFSILRPGEYRIDTMPDGNSTIVAVRSGDGEVNGGGQQFAVHERQEARVTGTDQITYDVGVAQPLDEWDRWCADRDQREERSVSARYVSREMPGYSDLDDNGDWSTSPEYGAVWMPRTVSPGWAPYRYGHWIWMEPWGWTWVDDAPWGYAPFHYGRWVAMGPRWGWIPGPRMGRPMYSPAMVAWIGGGNFGVGVRVGGPPVGWFPLGPREVYMPGYRTSRMYVTNLNMRNTMVTGVMVTNVYNNPGGYRYMHRGATTIVERDVFVHSRPVHGAMLRVSEREYINAPVGRVAMVAPGRESILGRSGMAGGARPPARIIERTVVVRHTPPPRPVAFAVRERALQANPGRPLERQQYERLRPANAESRPMYRPAMRPQGAGPERPVSRPGSERRTGEGQPAYRPRDERPTGQPRTEQPTYRRPETPRTEQPRTERPRTEPTYRAPQTPRTEQPRTEQPTYRRPETPRTEQPRTEQPTYRRPETPRTEQPRTEQPTYRRPETPRTEQPRTERPRTEPTYRAPQTPRTEQPRPTVTPQAPRENRREARPPRENKPAETRHKEDKK